MPDQAASVLTRLKNKAKTIGISYQQCLQLFFQEEFLRKLASSPYKNNFILKGGLFIYTLTNFESRATVDVDFLLRGLSNDMSRMDEIIAEILAVPTGNDFIRFEAKPTAPIAMQRKYHGISTQITGYIKNVRVPFSVDIGVGDIIVPGTTARTMQTQLDGFDTPEILTYSLESTVAEKLDAIQMAAFPAVAWQPGALFSRCDGRHRRIFAFGVGCHDPREAAAENMARGRNALDVRNRR